MMCPGPVNNLCSQLIFIKILKYFNVTSLQVTYHTNSLTNTGCEPVFYYLLPSFVISIFLPRHNCKRFQNHISTTRIKIANFKFGRSNWHPTWAPSYSRVPARSQRNCFFWKLSLRWCSCGSTRLKKYKVRNKYLC